MSVNKTLKNCPNIKITPLLTLKMNSLNLEIIIEMKAYHIYSGIPLAVLFIYLYLT